MHMYTLRFVIDLKTYHLHAPVPVSTTLSFPASLTVKHLKSFSNKKFSHQYFENFFFSISELALFQANNYMELVTFLI